ncbi:hypothetical protein FTUN_6834 [Frigoriglobus tundricola]|uniref:Lipoprotein n=1 Tax=Frigoriglobus tundricola TaxID=2774151 RepID=A0A6M5Z235_9BACT|nr:hypothetical protein FTUN_6834 [Frigoriglobus tundricola]
MRLMRRFLPQFCLALGCLALAGCTNAPVAGFLDSCFPCRTKQGTGEGGGPGVDVTPRPTPDTNRPDPPPGPGPLPPPDFGK